MIENNVPPPPPPKRTGLTALLKELQVGESRVVSAPNWRATAIAYRLFGRGNYRSRKEPGGVRIWRLG